LNLLGSPKNCIAILGPRKLSNFLVLKNCGFFGPKKPMLFLESEQAHNKISGLATLKFIFLILYNC